MYAVIYIRIPVTQKLRCKQAITPEFRTSLHRDATAAVLFLRSCVPCVTSMVACLGTAAGSRLLISIVLLFEGIRLNFREQMLMKAPC
jgi:hypothetical protein